MSSVIKGFLIGRILTDAPLITIGDVCAFVDLSRLAHLTLLTVSLWPLPGEKPPTMSLPEEGLCYDSLLGVCK